MIREWIDANGSDNIPAHLADLAKRAQVVLSTFTTPRQRDKRDKGQLSTPTATEGAQEGILTGLRFVLTGSGRSRVEDLASLWVRRGSSLALKLIPRKKGCSDIESGCKNQRRSHLNFFVFLIFFFRMDSERKIMRRLEHHPEEEFSFDRRIPFSRSSTSPVSSVPDMTKLGSQFHFHQQVP